MDSVTQFVLGAAIGEATLKNEQREPSFKFGAALLGGLVGTLPDLDVLTAPFLDGPEALASHRGLSHSLFFCTLLSLLLAWLFSRLFSARGLSLKHWLRFTWLGLNTHWMLDCFTTYGTQIFQPFSDYPINIGAVFIIDPLYTLPLLFGLGLSLWSSRKGKRYQQKWVHLGLILSTMYLSFACCSKWWVWRQFESSWTATGKPMEQMITVATPFNSLLWYAYVDTGDDVYVGCRALLDSPENGIAWQRVSKNKHLIPDFGKGKAGRTLLWFSRGFYRLDIHRGKPTFSDLRFGRIRSWLVESDPATSDYIFRYELLPKGSKGPFQDFRPLRPEGRISEFPWRLLLRRISGDDGEGSAKRSTQ